jgi:APA family basic amino acid/polyamine antiporter
MKSPKLNLLEVSMIVVSLVIGMGIFRTPVNVARESTSIDMFFWVWTIGGVAALCGALTYAEIGSRYPVTGGYYKIFSHCYHPSIAFAINCIILVGNAASLAGVSLIGSEYLTNVIFPDIENTKFITLSTATITILIFYLVNLLGLKASSKTLNALTIIKIGMVVLLIGALFTGNFADTNLETVVPSGGGVASTLKALGICLVAVSFTYGGYQQVINFGGEVKNAPKTLPKGIFIGIAFILILYLGINYTYYKVIGFEGLKEAESVAAILAGAIFGEKGFVIFSILLFLSVLAYINVMLMSNPRVMYAMSDEGIIPSLFKRINSQTNVLVISLTTFTALCIIMLFYAKTFDTILNYIIFLDSIGMATSAATIFILRKKTAHLRKKDIYTVRLYPWVPLFFIASYVLAGTSIAFTTPKAAIVSLSVFAVFFALYFLLKKWNKNKIK